MTRIETVDLFLLQVPDFDPVRDPVKDTLLVRVRAGSHEGWGECEAAPFVSLAAFVTPESHDTSRPVGASLTGKTLEGPRDIADITRQVATHSMNILQAPHVYSGVEMALWDALGKMRDEPVYRLLGYEKAFRKLPYVVMPFAPTAEETCRQMQDALRAGYRAVKTGWNGFGRGDLVSDRDQLAAARQGLGADGRLFLDLARVWGKDLESARRYYPLLDEFDVEFVEEPFDGDALGVYAEMARDRGCRQVAAGENVHSAAQAHQLLDQGGVGVVQIDLGRIGGIAATREVAGYADRQGAFFVNHTYTSHLTLSAALQAYAGLERHNLCEYPMDQSSLSWAVCGNHLELDADGMVRLLEEPGLGIALDLEAVKKYLVDLEIRFGHTVLYRTPEL